MKHWNSKLLEQLLQVQDTDLKIRRLDLQIQVFHQRSKEEDSELSRIKAEITRIDEALAATESQNQMYATTLEDIRSAIKGLLTTKSGAPKPRTRSSTEALKIEEEKLESLLEETGDQLVRLRENRENLVVKATGRTEELESDNEGPEAEIRKLQQQIRRLEKQREEEVQGVPQLLLKHYDRLRSSRSGVGLTILKDGVCTVCCMTMPTAIASKLSHGEKISMCPACGRMVARIEHTLRSESDLDLSGDAAQKKPKKEKKILSASRETADERKAALKKTLKRSMEKKFSGIDTDFDEEDIMVSISDAALVKRETKVKKVGSAENKKEMVPASEMVPAPTVRASEKGHVEKAEEETTVAKASQKKAKGEPVGKKAEKIDVIAQQSDKSAKTKKAPKPAETAAAKKHTEKSVAAPPTPIEAAADGKAAKKQPTTKKSEKESSIKKPVSKTSEKKAAANSKQDSKKKISKSSPQKAAAAPKSTVKKQSSPSKKTETSKAQPAPKTALKSKTPKSAPPKPAGTKSTPPKPAGASKSTKTSKSVPPKAAKSQKSTGKKSGKSQSKK